MQLLTFLHLPRLAILLSLATSLTVSSGIAQQTYVGLNAGLVLSKSKISFDGINLLTDNVAALAVAAPVELPLSQYLSLLVTPAFQQRGYKLEFTDEFSSGGSSYKYEDKLSLRINYGSISSMLLLNIPYKRLIFSAGAGLGGAYALNGYYTESVLEIEDGEVLLDEKLKEDVDFDESEFNRFNFEFIIGPRVAYAAGPGKFTFDAFFAQQLNNSGEEDENGVDLGTFRFRSWSFSLGYAFAVGAAKE